jgi:cyclophilin family peptidyl-prolyl cis-trans isomerase
VTVRFARGLVLDHFLALQRELEGRYSWEATLLPHPVAADVDGFRRGLAAWRTWLPGQLPTALAQARSPSDVHGLLEAGPDEPGTGDVVRALDATWDALSARLVAYESYRDEQERAVAQVLRDHPLVAQMDSALGAPAWDGEIAVHLVPFAPHPPGAGLIGSRGTTTGVYVDVRRFRGSMAVDTVLSLLGWVAILGPRVDAHLAVALARALPGSSPYHRRLRALLTKTIVEYTAGALTRQHHPSHRPCVEALGTSSRYPRLYARVERHWGAYLDGWSTRNDAIDALAEDVGTHSPRWFVDHVDPSSLAADFYLLELLAARGDDTAARLLGAWLPRLCGDLHTHLDTVIANELGHYETVPPGAFGEELRPLLSILDASGDSRVGWPAARAELGHAPALRLAEAAFAGPGAAHGGDAWRPVAAMARRYVLHELPDQVFADQCFTLEHNNGSLFDKFFDTTHMRSLLDAQAVGDVEALAARASQQVRGLLRRQQDVRVDTAAVRPPRLGEVQAGEVGCGSADDADAWRPGSCDGDADPIAVRRYEVRRPRPDRPPPSGVRRALLRTELGDVGLSLWPERKPHTVENFVRLARGGSPWRDPMTNQVRTSPYYDGTLFHRRVPGFLVEGGDRSGTGLGGPGYRIPDEIDADDDFSVGFLLAMSNIGRDSAGGRFFLTVVPAPHLAGRFATFGSVEPESRSVVLEIADARDPVLLIAVVLDDQGTRRA